MYSYVTHNFAVGANRTCFSGRQNGGKAGFYTQKLYVLIPSAIPRIHHRLPMMNSPSTSPSAKGMARMNAR